MYNYYSRLGFFHQTQRGRKICSQWSIQQYTTFNQKMSSCQLYSIWFFMYNNKAILCKKEFIPPIPDSMISVYYCKKTTVTFFTDNMTSKFECFLGENGCAISNWNENILAADVRWIMVRKRYTTIRLFLSLDRMDVSILQWTAFRWIYWNFLSGVKVITTQTDTHIWHSEFIGSPCKTIFCEYGGGWYSIQNNPSTL